MTTRRRLKVAGAAFALAAAVTCTQIWGDSSGDKRKKNAALSGAIRTPRDAAAVEESTAGRFDARPVVTFQTLAGELHFALQVRANTTEADARPRDLAVVVDTSASQAGFALKNARLIAEAVTKAARPGDRVAIWTINTPEATRDLAGGFQSAGSAKLTDALTYLATREYAAGAVDLKTGLNKILRSFTAGADRRQAVLFLGDGESALNPLSDADRCALASEMTGREIAFFPVPLGNKLDAKNLHGLATGTGGMVVRMLGEDKVETFQPKLETALAAPIFYPTAASPKYSEGVTESLPNRLPPLRPDAPTLLVGIMKPSATIGLKVDGTVAGKKATVTVSEQVPASDPANYFLVNIVHQWRGADHAAPALVRADRGLALAYEQTRLAREEALTQGHWALSQNNLGAAKKLFESAKKIDPNDTESAAGLKVVQKLLDGTLTREQIKAKLSDPKAVAAKISAGENGVVQVVRQQLPALADDPPADQLPPPAVAPGAPGAAANPGDLLELEKRRRAVQEQQTQQVVEDTIKRAHQLLGSDPDSALDLLKRQLASVRENTDLSDRLRATLASRLEAALRSGTAEGTAIKQRQEAELQRRIADEQFRAALAAQQSDHEKIRERVRAFGALMNQARYEEAYKEALVLQQEQLSKGKEIPVQATAGYQMALNAANLREFEELRRIKEDRFLLTMLQVEKSSVPFPDEPPVEFPPAAAWRELSAFRKERYDVYGLDGVSSKKAIQIREKLNQPVSIDKPIENLPLREALDFFSEKYDLTFIVDEQAFEEEGNKTILEQMVRLPKMPGVSLQTALRFLLAQVKGNYIIRKDYVEITTFSKAASEKAVRAYPVADLVIPIPNGINNQSLNQNLQVLGSSLSANGQAIFGQFGSNQALGFAGPLGALGTLGALGALGAGGGGVAIGGIGGVGGGVAGGGATGAQFQGALGFAGGNNQTNLGFGGGTLGFGGGQQGQFGNLGGQFGIQGGDTSSILIELIQDVIAPKEWALRAARYLFNNVNVAEDENDMPFLNPDQLNSLGYYQPARALVVRATSRIQTRVGGGAINAPRPGGMGAAERQRNGDAIVIAPGGNRNNGGTAVAKAPAKAADPKPEAKVEVAKKDEPRDPKKVWQEAVEKGLMKPRQVIAVADVLAHFEKFDEVAELLKADLRVGVLARPCCYDALAIALKSTGASPDEVERVRLSAIDLNPTNPQGFLAAAEAMSEMGRPEKAVEFCKRAAALEPNASDPYAKGLVYLTKSKDVDGDSVQWAAGNLLRREWTANQNQGEAQKALLEIAGKLKTLGRTAEADKLLSAIDSEKQRDLTIEMVFADQADLDLQVKEPSGTTCSPAVRQTTGGGLWRGDNYFAKDRKDAYRETYVASEAFSGAYEVTVKTIWGKPLGNKVTILVTRHQGTPQESKELHRLELSVDGTAHLKVELTDGRRTELASVPPPMPRRVDTLASGTSVSNSERVFGLLRSMSEPTLANRAGMAGGTSASGSLTSQILDQPTELGREMVVQSRVPGSVGAGAGMQNQTTVSADGRSLRMSVAPAFQTASAEPDVRLSLIPGGK
ncbi:MAG: VWA domain-containing protein [Gemmataceae bacterium]